MGRRILIVEDEMLLAVDLELLPESQGCMVELANSVDRALALAEAERPDAVNLDMNTTARRPHLCAEGRGNAKKPAGADSQVSDIVRELVLVAGGRFDLDRTSTDFTMGNRRIWLAQ